MKSLQGKTALVTGASRGISRAAAERLARDGAAVVVNYATSNAEADAVVAGIEREGGTAIAVKADVARLDDIRRPTSYSGFWPTRLTGLVFKHMLKHMP